MRIPRVSVRSYVLAWITPPLIALLVADTYVLYRSALHSVNSAYDRTLLATTHAVGDSIRFENGRYRVSLPLALFEIYESDHSGRYFYRVSKPNGDLISGDDELRPFQGSIPRNVSYPAVVQYYEDVFRGEAIRVAALLQPVFSNDESGTVIIQVAEPMRIRKGSARDIFSNTLFRQVVLILAVCLAVYVAVTRALRPLNQLRDELDRRSADDLSSLTPRSDLIELNTVTQAMNMLMQRLAMMISQQKRFIANASHQLRTPLAVLKTQVQSGLRGDVPSTTVLGEIEKTVERTITLANQMLLLAKVEQHRSQGFTDRCNLGNLAREAAIELSPLIAEKYLDFAIENDDSEIRGDAWLVGELVRNLLSNAIQHTPFGRQLGMEIARRSDKVRLLVWDTGGGLTEDQRENLFKPFATGFSNQGSGLGLAIAHEIATSLNGRITLHNRLHDDDTIGLNAVVVFNVYD